MNITGEFVGRGGSSESALLAYIKVINSLEFIIR